VWPWNDKRRIAAAVDEIPDLPIAAIFDSHARDGAGPKSARPEPRRSGLRYFLQNAPLPAGSYKLISSTPGRILAFEGPEPADLL
jgi:hypothetical protein